MRLVCPECGEPIVTENINVQEMVAACIACDSVFRFDIPDEKDKIRKVKRPERLHEHEETGILDIWFTRVLGKDETIARIGVSVASGFLTILTFLTFQEFLNNEEPLILSIVLGFLMLVAYYILSLIMLNKTRIMVDGQQISLRYEPLLNPFEDAVTVDCLDIENIICEETEDSKKAGSLKRYYHVGAELVDGNRVLIIKDKPEQYAKYIAQRLEEQIQNSTEDAIGNLEETLNTEDILDLIHDEEKLDSLEAKL